MMWIKPLTISRSRIRAKAAKPCSAMRRTSWKRCARSIESARRQWKTFANCYQPDRGIGHIGQIGQIGPIRLIRPIRPISPSAHMPETFITPHGDYRQLHAYQASEAAFDMTFHFCERFLRKGDRTIDQMVQAARSGKQNIAEGSRASGTSKEMEVKLMNIARASLEELLLDYEDYLRVRDLPMWKRDSVEATAARDIYRSDRAEQTSRLVWETRSADVVANVAICL